MSGYLDLIGESHPTRGAWIEMIGNEGIAAMSTGRTPHGVRGLKSYAAASVSVSNASHPARGAWIEISKFAEAGLLDEVAPRTGCVD